MRDLVVKAGVALGILALVGTVAGTVGEAWWIFDLASNFRLQYFIAAGIAAIVTFAARLPLLGIAFGVVSLFNAALVAPLYASEPPPVAGDARMEIASSNMQTHNSRQQINWLTSTEPDLIFLFESSRQAEDLIREADLGYEVTSGIDPDDAFGLSILSKDPFEFEVLPSSRDGGDAVRLEARLGNETIVVYAIHPPSPSNPVRSESRDKLLERIGRAAAEETLPVVVVGDFNATPWSAGFRKLVEPADLANSQDGFGFGATWHANWPAFAGVPLDHLVHSRDLTTVNREVGPSAGPDHRPIRVELGFAEIDA
ncbi:MAG TPA: endonuclease/exonuclease/phosphatase family protein [Acidimicrobiia bacterium]|jgi:endonuclease/exonuclease/phosphatase (EEP) superfamily protein YafD|nr:endonuclease/exonuclease/phosphatase family protein [Acidimicrobiia bacterium]